MLALAFLEGAAAFFVPFPEEELSAFFGAAAAFDFAVFAIRHRAERASSIGWLAFVVE
jgi:hypothetical protein